MKFLKSTAICSLLFCAVFANGAEDNKDRSYVADFVGKKVNLSMKDVVSGKISNVTLKEAKPKELVFADAEAGGEFTVPTNNVSFRFAYAKTDDLNHCILASNRGDLDLAITGLRQYVYPVIGLLVLPENSFYQLNETLEMFVSSLLKKGKIKEASALVKTLPLTHANVETQKRAMEIGKAMVAAGDVKGALDVLNRIPLSSEYEEIYPDVMDFAAAVRKVGVSEGILRFYAQLGNAQQNSIKDACTLWAIYCEVMRGSMTSAKLSLGTLKGTYKNSDKNFSLYKMVDGIRAVKENKYEEALDLFAEGIVFANVSDPCLPELLFNTGKAYKHIKNVTAANEIFKQITLLYPNDPIAPQAEKEIVKEQKKKEAE